MHRRFWLAALGFALVVSPARGAADKDEAIAHDHALIAGRWRVVSLVVNGNAVADEDARRIVVVNGRQGEWEVLVDGNRAIRGTSTIDPTTTPREIDAEVTEGDGAGGKILGIYEASAKTRRVCYAGADRTRPGEFTAEPGSERTLVVFERLPED